MYELPHYSLETLEEIVEFSRVAVTALVNCDSTHIKKVKRSALDYMTQKVLRLGSWKGHFDNDDSNSTSDMAGDMADTTYVMESYYARLGACKILQCVITSFCCETASAHNEAVEALTIAVSIEASNSKMYACRGIVKVVAQFLLPGTRSRVIKAILKTELANNGSIVAVLDTLAYGR